MPHSARRVQREQWLAVLDGRFLPVDSLEFSIESDTENVYSTGSIAPSATVTRAEMVQGKLETRRDPCPMPKPQQLRLYDDDREYLLWDLAVNAGVGTALGEAYTVSFQAMSYSVRER